MSTHVATDARDVPWLSVLIPAHDVAAYIEVTLHSVLAQAGGGVEIVLYDDASTDDTRARAEALAVGAAAVRIIGEPHNRGVAHARNRLLAAARGRYVWFLDGDDRLLPGAVAGLRRVVAESAPDLVLCDFRVEGALRPWRRRRSTFDGPAEGDASDVLLAGALRAAQLHAWSKIARRELWQSVRFPARRRFEDMSASVALMAAAGSWRHVASPWIGYRQRPGSLMRTLGIDDLRDYAQALQDVRRHTAAVANRAPKARCAVDYYLLRGHASIARRLHAMDVPASDPVARACRNGFRLDFPDGPEDALASCRARIGRLRAHRIASAFARAGWR